MRIHENLVPRKGQVASLDMVTALITVLGILVLAHVSHYQVLGGSMEREEQMKLKKKLYESTESLLTTPGKPMNWEKSEKSPVRIGLAQYSDKSVKNHLLDPGKLKKLKKIPYEEFKDRLNLHNEETYLEIKKLQGEKVLEKGKSIPKGVQVTRIALINNEICTIKMQAK